MYDNVLHIILRCIGTDIHHYYMVAGVYIYIYIYNMTVHVVALFKGNMEWDTPLLTMYTHCTNFRLL